MKNKYTYLLGIIAIAIANLFLKNYIRNHYNEYENTLNFYKIVSESTLPIVVFLIFKYYYPKKLNILSFSLGMLLFMMINVAISYFSETSSVNYNSIIGMILGTVLAFVINIFLKKITLTRSNT